MKASRVVALIALLSASSSAAHAQARDRAVISRFIAGQASKLGGQEYREARKMVAGDLNHDGVPDAAVLYTLEGIGGGNNYTQYLAVFLRDKDKGLLVPAAHATVGGKLYREARLQSITDGAILFNIVSYEEKDAACCPSKKGATRYVLADGKLQEQK